MKFKIFIIAGVVLGGIFSAYSYIKTNYNFSNIYWIYYFQSIIVGFVAIYKIFLVPNSQINDMSEEVEKTRSEAFPGFSTSTSPPVAMKVTCSLGSIVFGSIMLFLMYLYFNEIKTEYHLAKTNPAAVIVATLLYGIANIFYLIFFRSDTVAKDSPLVNARKTENKLSSLMLQLYYRQMLLLFSLAFASYAYPRFGSKSLYLSLIALVTIVQAVSIARD
ncbi:MAG: hypothetical protein U0R17_02445 [Acidimicrobiia bacterium]